MFYIAAWLINDSLLPPRDMMSSATLCEEHRRQEAIVKVYIGTRR